MKPLYKKLLLLETFICFGPIYILLSLGLISFPITVMLVYEGRYSEIPYAETAMVIGGFMGMTAIITMLVKILDHRRKMLPRAIVISFIVVGTISLILPYTYMQGDILQWPIIVFLFPLLATVHIVYLARHYLSAKTANKALNPDADKAPRPLA